MQREGILLKGIGGFYYVDSGDEIFECKAKGIFRKMKISPLVGDRVSITVRDNGENTIDEIAERRNSFVRPPVANIDQMIYVSSIVEPVVNTLIIDKMIAIAEKKEIEPVIVFTKSDLSNSDEYVDIYKKAGFKTFSFSKEDEDVSVIKNLITGKVSFFSGNTGVGKSTLINKLSPSLNLSTGEISEKLGRGKHTTRQAELFKICGGYVIDTPGFSSLDFTSCETITKDELQFYFREFEDCLGNCQFADCSHTCEKGCAVIEKLRADGISQSRHKNYCSIYNELKEVKFWEK